MENEEGQKKRKIRLAPSQQRDNHTDRGKRQEREKERERAVERAWQCITLSSLSLWCQLLQRLSSEQHGAGASEIQYVTLYSSLTTTAFCLLLQVFFLFFIFLIRLSNIIFTSFRVVELEGFLVVRLLLVC